MSQNKLWFTSKKKWQALKQIWQAEPLFYSLLISFIIIGAILRLYRLEATLLFQGDQGRDALIVARIFKEGDLAFIGPVTSIGNMYLGPFYYYFMLPFLWCSYPSPLGPAFGVAVVNILAIFLIYYWGQTLVGKKGALWASFFLAFSQIALVYSRFSWNPNLTIFFSLLTLYLTHQARQLSSKYWLGVALAAGLLIQLHYVNLILLPVVGLNWLQQWWNLYQKKSSNLKKFYLHSLSVVIIFALTFMPLVLFDWKHDWRNWEAMTAIFKTDSPSTLLEPNHEMFLANLALLKNIPGRLTHLFATLFWPNLDFYLPRVIFGVLMLGLVIYLGFFHRSKYHQALQLLSLTSLISILALLFYNHSIFDHYLLFFLPILFLFCGYLINLFSQKKYYLLICLSIGIFYLLGNYRSGFFKPTAPQLSDLDRITSYLLGYVNENDKFDFLLLDDNRNYYGDNYRFYFSTKTNQILPVERFDEADIYFVIDETKKADLYQHETYQLQTFLSLPDATLSALAHDDGPVLYKFVRRKQ